MLYANILKLYKRMRADSQMSLVNLLKFACGLYRRYLNMAKYVRCAHANVFTRVAYVHTVRTASNPKNAG